MAHFLQLVTSLITEPGSYTVYDSPHDGSCMYHSVSAVLQPIMREHTPSAEGLKAALQVFYSQRGQLQQNMERLLTITFEDKLKDVSQEDHWGEFTDAFNLAIIYSIQTKVAIVNSTENIRMKSITHE